MPLSPLCLSLSLSLIVCVCEQEWKNLTLYKLKARHPVGLKDKDGRPCDPNHVLKLAINLYKTPKNLVCLDIQKLFGPTFLYLDMCSKLLNEIQTQPP